MCELSDGLCALSEMISDWIRSPGLLNSLECSGRATVFISLVGMESLGLGRSTMVFPIIFKYE